VANSFRDMGLAPVATLVCSFISLLVSQLQAATIDFPGIEETYRQGIIYITVPYVLKGQSDEKKVYGTGFFVTSDGYAVTDYHVVVNWLAMSDSDKVKHPIEARRGALDGPPVANLTVKDFDVDSDFVLLKTDNLPVVTLPTCFARSLVSSDSIYAFGFGDGHNLAPTKGLFSNDGSVVPPPDSTGGDDENRNPNEWWTGL
jgi:S1-C subfamily serine protease